MPNMTRQFFANLVQGDIFESWQMIQETVCTLSFTSSSSSSSSYKAVAVVEQLVGSSLIREHNRG